MLELETKDEFLKNQSHEQLEIFIKNDELRIEDLQKRLFLLSGCGTFGESDPMNGSCVDCYYENRNLWERCHAFENMVSAYDKRQKNTTGNIVYEVLGYDKDADVFISLYKNNSYQQCVSVARVFKNLIAKDALRNPETGEPLDWLEIVESNDWDTIHYKSYEDEE